MPLLAWAKLRTAARLRNKALGAEAKETLACAYLSLALFVGLVLNLAFGWWWADPVAALELPRFRGRFGTWVSSGLWQHPPLVVDG